MDVTVVVVVVVVVVVGHVLPVGMHWFGLGFVWGQQKKPAAQVPKHETGGLLHDFEILTHRLLLGQHLYPCTHPHDTVEVLVLVVVVVVVLVDVVGPEHQHRRLIFGPLLFGFNHAQSTVFKARVEVPAVIVHRPG